MIIKTTLEFRGYEEREWQMNNSRGITRLASFLDPVSLTVYKLDVAEDYAAEFKVLGLEVRREYDVVLAMNAQPQITNDTTYGRDRFVMSSRNFICRFEIKEVCPISVTSSSDTGTAGTGTTAGADAGKKGGK